MPHLLTTDALVSLLTLTVMEIVLGVDNVIFVSIIMGRLEKRKQLYARRIWMFAGIATRVVLLIILDWLVKNGTKEWFSILSYKFNVRNIIMLAGGLFLLIKTVHEMHNKLEGVDVAVKNKKRTISFGSVMGQIILIDIIFSFDSIITAVGLAKHVEIMMIAVIIAMVIMFLFSGKIARFIDKHPTLKILALSFLLMVGFSLFFEGLEPIHKAHIDKSYIYVAMAFSFVVELLNMRMQKKSKPVVLNEPHINNKSI